MLDAVISFLRNPLFVTFAIAAITIYATLIAPKIGKRGKLIESFDRFVPIRLSTKHSKVAVTYRIDDREIADDIYVAEFSFKNSGFMDIQQESFRQPIRITAPQNTTFLSLEVNSPTENEAQISDDGREIWIKWSLLKRNESVSVSSICAIPSGLSIEKNDFETFCRLANVDSKTPGKTGTLVRYALPFILPIILILLIGWFEDAGRSGLYYNGPGEQGYVVFQSHYSEFLICEPAPLPLWPRSCSAAQPIPSDLSHFSPRSGVVGRPLWLLLLAILGPFLAIGSATLLGLFINRFDRKLAPLRDA